jgi:hypothetical protein
MLHLFLIFSYGSCLLALANLKNMPALDKFILLSFNILVIIINSPMNKLIAFCTHFSFMCMITRISNIAIRSAHIADFQRYHTINIGEINYMRRSENGVKFWPLVSLSFFRRMLPSFSIVLVMEESK